MANKSSVPRVPKSQPQPTISGMDGAQMHNEILLGLPHKECDVLFPDLEYLQMRTHDALHEVGQPITLGYFVNGGLASVLNVMADGKSAEVGLAERGFRRIAAGCRFEDQSYSGRDAGCRQRIQD